MACDDYFSLCAKFNGTGHFFIVTLETNKEWVSAACTEAKVGTQINPSKGPRWPFWPER